MNLKLIILSLLCSFNLHAQVSSVDALGNELNLKQAATRIISLAPHTTELLFAAGADQQLIAVVNYSDYPEKAKKLPQVGSYNRLDIEAILALNPDMIVAWKSGNPDEALLSLEKLGLKIFYSEPRNLESISSEIVQLGKLLGTENIANSVAHKFNKKLKNLSEKYSKKRPVKLFYQVWNKPLMTINGQHLISDVIRLCGAKNVFGDLSLLAPKVDIEAVIQASPEIIVAGTNESRSTWLAEWNKWTAIPAVKNHYVYGINADLIVRHTPRILQGASEMCEYINRARQKSAP